ncbi:inositol monophosphatase family protein [Microbacterium oryzae]|uniref:inositol monophosphatase family protein n=1 Tax=Microbacterium oryzae TaxID=743009 RepID=UPI0025B0EB41|nr:inositol monophosphatase family protein [Microbacterium oryzae]MDN3311148.1 inositol monophosphatase family protein [Microbacterium oryzae]
MTLELELRDLAVDIAREAGDLARRRRQEGVAIAASKSTLADIVTEADREVETLIRSRLAEARPEDGFLGEESGAEEGTSGITWVVDPIDGTVNYAFGQPAYGVSIAAVSGPPEPTGWEPLAGVVVAPVLDEVFSAARGHGAHLGERRLSVTMETPAGALIATGFGYDPETHAGALDELRKVMPIARDIRRAGAASLDLAYVAAGRLDAYYERGLKPWDMAAGALLVSEAGGRAGWLGVDSWGRRLLVAAGEPLFEQLAGVFSD